MSGGSLVQSLTLPCFKGTVAGRVRLGRPCGRL